MSDNWLDEMRPRIEYFDHTLGGGGIHAKLTGWYWLDKTRGVWNGPFKSAQEAEMDYLKDPPWERFP